MFQISVDTFLMKLMSKKLIGWLLIVISHQVLAENGHINFQNNKAQSEFKLDVIEESFAETLRVLSKNTGILIHYSALPEGKVTMNCVQSTVTGLMKCLLGKHADFVFRFPSSASQLANVDKPKEIWVLGRNEDTTDVYVHSTLDSKESQKLNKLLLRAKDNDPVLRADALATLILEAPANHSEIRKAFTDALLDTNPQVREQAVSGLARREGDKALKELQTALQDKEASVRLMVVDNAGSNMDLLQQALTDEDELVRNMARMKIAELSNSAHKP